MKPKGILLEYMYNFPIFGMQKFGRFLHRKVKHKVYKTVVVGCHNNILLVCSMI